MTIERTDFMSVPVQDMGRAKRFYSETLGIHSPNVDDGWPEFETGNVSLYLVDPTRFGQEFRPNVAHIALRVPTTSPRRVPSWKPRESSSSARSETPASVTWRSSRTPRGTR